MTYELAEDDAEEGRLALALELPAVAVPLANAWKAPKVLSPEVGGLTAKTIPAPQCPCCLQYTQSGAEVSLTVS